jgi:hypothetical protein
MKNIILMSLVSITTASFLVGRELPLPHEYASKAVYHIQVKQLDAFSCGYNVLFNAANFENLCGFRNTIHQYRTFQNRILPYLQSQGYDPSKTSTNAVTDHLAQKVLGLQPFYHLHIKNEKGRRIVPLLVDKTRITFPSGTSEREVQKLMKKAVEERQQSVIENISTILNQKIYAVVHFLCYVTSERGIRHGILISLLKNSSGRGLYIFDNLNEKLTKYSEAIRFVDYLCTTFQVNTTQTFSGPAVPDQWPFTD